MRGSPACPALKVPKGRIAIEFVEGADLVRAIMAPVLMLSGAKLVVKNVKVLSPEMETTAFGDREVLRKLYIPIRCFGQTQASCPRYQKVRRWRGCWLRPILIG